MSTSYNTSQQKKGLYYVRAGRKKNEEKECRLENYI